MNVNKTGTKIEFTSKEYRGILSNLRKINKYFDDPRVWVQEEYKTLYNFTNPKTGKVKEGFQYCLIGAAHEVNGFNKNNNTQVFMCMNLPNKLKQSFLKDIKRNIRLEEDNLGVGESLPKDIYTTAIYGAVCEHIEDFNDDPTTTYRIIRVWLQKLIKKAQAKI